MVSKKRNVGMLWAVVAILVLALALGACGGAGTPATSDPAEQTEEEAAPEATEATEEEAAPEATEATEEEAAEATEEPVAEATATVDIAAAAESAVATIVDEIVAAGPEAYNLQPGKPYDGTELRLLICCPTAGQFAQMGALTGEGSAFEELTGISVTWDAGPYGAFQERLLVEASSGTGDFDAMAWVDSWGHAIKPFLLPLNDLIERDGIDMSDFPQVYLTAASGSEAGTEENVYGIPFRGHPFLLYYRSDVFEELGLDVPTNWQEIVEAGQVIKEETDLDPISMYYGAGGAGQNLFIWLSHLWGSGGDVFDAEYRPSFNDETGVAATEAYVDILCDTELTSPSSITYNEGDAAIEMHQGRAAMFVNWWWRWSEFQNPNTTIPEVMGKVAFAPAPGWEGGDAATYGHIWPVGISQFSQNQEAAWEFIKFITNPEIEKQVALNKSNPTLANNVVVHFSNMRDAEVNEANGGVPEVGAEVLENARTQPLVSNWNEVQSILEIGINDMATNCDTDVQERLNQMAEEVEAAMERAGYYD